MQPSPPCANHAKPRASSPDSSRKSGPNKDRKRDGRVTSPLVGNAGA